MDEQSKRFKQNFLYFMNNKGIVENGTKTQEELDAEAAAGGQGNEIDWENDLNPYKKRYTDSQGQVSPLVNTLKNFAEYDHNTKTWKPKTQKVESQVQEEENLDFDKLFEGYDPEFTKNLKRAFSPIQEKLSRYEKQEKEKEFVTNYNEGVKSSRAKSIEEFGDEYEYVKDGKFNPASPLYKLADEILTKEYCQFNADGTFHRYSNPDAEYLATVRAYSIIQKKLKTDPNFLSGKSKLGAIQGKGSTGGGGKRNLSFEEYSKLSDEQKDAYDMQQVG